MKAAATAACRTVGCALALVGLSAHGLAQDQTMSLEEVSYRAGKARIMARYQEDLTICNGLGNAQARSACAAAAGVNRDTARRALKSGLGPTALGRYLTQVAAQQHPTAHQATHPAVRTPVPAATPATARRPMPVTAAVSPAATPAPRATPTQARADTAAPVEQGHLPTQVAAVEAKAPPTGSSLVDGYALALKTHYGGN